MSGLTVRRASFSRAELPPPPSSNDTLLALDPPLPASPPPPPPLAQDFAAAGEERGAGFDLGVGGYRSTGTLSTLKGLWVVGLVERDDEEDETGGGVS